jgi:homoserine O-succinyltransferase
MPLIAHTNLPTFTRLEREGEMILSKARAHNQTIRELRIGLLNMMPDAALEATERQFFRLIGRSNQIAQFYLHPFTLSSITRQKKAAKHIKKHYQTFDEIKAQGLDALIITGAHVESQELQQAPFYQELKSVVDWAYEHVTSTLCSCLATHAVMECRYQQKRQQMSAKCWGVFPHQVINRTHPLMQGVNTQFDVPHSRFNEITIEQFKHSGIEILVTSKAGAHLCVSPDLLRIVFLQGHPEYDTISLLKEYKREVLSFINKTRLTYPTFPENYLNAQSQAILNEYQVKLLASELNIKHFPEALIAQTLNNTWGNATNALINNWIGCVYQVTHEDINKPFMQGVNPNDPLNLK